VIGIHYGDVNFMKMSHIMTYTVSSTMGIKMYKNTKLTSFMLKINGQYFKLLNNIFI